MSGVESVNVSMYNRIGTMPNGDGVYVSVNPKSDGKTKLVVPKENIDKFEKMNSDMVSTMVNDFASKDKMKKSRMWMGLGAVLGAGIGVFFTRNSSMLKKCLVGALGLITGGVVAGLACLKSFVGDMKNYGNQMKDLGVKAYKEEG